MPEPDMSVWTGRVDVADGPDALRWHQMVKPVTPGCPAGIVLIGFACDEGVRRNGGRVGAKDGPRAIRKALANLAWHQTAPVYDAGDVRCDDGDMEGAQARLAEVVADTIRAGHRPLILGGGHETAWGTFQGIVAAKPGANVGIINIDAHFDLRADEPGNSGTPFNQMAKWCKANGKPFRYFALGISGSSNTRALHDRARSLGVGWQWDYEFAWRSDARSDLIEFVDSLETLHLSIDLDVLPAATMPAVSAPAALGVPLVWVEQLICWILRSQKVAAVDIVEFNPALDSDGNAARVASRLGSDAAKVWGEIERESS